MSALASNLMAIVDVETTGLFPWRNDRIVEVAVVIMSPDGTIHDEYDTLVNPDRDLGPTRIHHISAAEILDAPKFSEIAGDIAELLRRSNLLAGHNVSFDRKFLVREYERIGIEIPDVPIFCTCQRLGRNNLAACCVEFGIEFSGQPHRALSDARATALLVQKLIEDDPAILEDFPQQQHKWPLIRPLFTPTVSREHARRTMEEPPKFLQRIISKMHYDTEATPPDIIAYLTLIDRVLEDRVVDPDEENIIVDAIGKWGLTLPQVMKAHETYIHNLAVQALSDGVVTDVERSDLHQVARLLGYDRSNLDEILESAALQLQATESKKPAGSQCHDLRGKRVCFTGELLAKINGQPISRAVAEALAEKAGLVVANSVTKNLDLLVVADPNTQSGKAKKARKYGTRILADSVFWRLIEVPVE